MQASRGFFKMWVCMIMSFLVLGLWTGLTFAQEVPHLIKYEGDLKILLKETGKAQGEDKKEKKGKVYDLTFKIYNVTTGGNPLWEETHPNIKKGEFELLLGSINPLDLRFDEDYWLSIEIGSWGEIEPRERMTSFGYAYMAEDTWKLGGRFPEEYALTEHSHLGEDIVTPVAEAVNADMVDGLHAHEIGGVKDHGQLEGLQDDDHLQYLNNVRGDARYGGAGWDGLTKLGTVQSHIADKDNPHEVTLEQLGGLLWTDAGTYIYPDNTGDTFRITDGGDLVLPGRVGIGTTEPEKRLHLHEGTMLISGNGPAATAALELRGTSDGALLRFTNTWSDKWGEIFIADPNGPTPNYGGPGSMNFRVNSTDMAEMTISANGNVGIGIVDPSEKLEVDGMVKAVGFIGDGSLLTGIAGGGIAGPVNEALNADTVDGLHASQTPIANYLYPLNENAKFPADIVEGKISDADMIDGKDSSEFSLVGHQHALPDLTDVSADEAAAFNAAGEAGASATNRLATMADVEAGGSGSYKYAEMVIGTNYISTNSVSFVTMPDMVATADVSGNPVKITFDASISLETGNNHGDVAIFIDGVEKASRYLGTSSGGDVSNTSLHWLETLSPGTHRIEIKWKSRYSNQFVWQKGSAAAGYDTGGLPGDNNQGPRVLIIEEL